MNADITLANIHDFNPQQVFDFVVDRLRAQGVPSVAPNSTSCAYLTTDADGTPLRCAAGHLMTCMARHRIAEYEGRTVACVVADNFTVSPRYQHLVTGLQKAHDQWADGRDFDAAFGHVASAFDLVYRPETSDDNEYE